MKSEYLKGIKTFASNSKSEFLKYILKNKQILIAVNAEKIMMSSQETKAIINRNFGYPDGIGAVWALKRKGHKKVVKIAGCELWLDIINHYYKEKTFYLVGGKQQVIEETVEKLKKEFKGINILNYRNGYVKTDQEKKDLINDIKTLKPNVVFVAMGSPKQELLMEDIQKEHQATYQGLGGSFDVYTGNVQRAPKIWIKFNLEWAYRLLNEPKRIKRQVVYLPFIIKLLFNKI
ncbi:WecB/TagA/CpsF family glycosyltransferase [Flavobacteriaceae bacterium]|nr:WecB/TagA/CpsF family glycosyltransferase [Flavobacteriaceae bacterium]